VVPAPATSADAACNCIMLGFTGTSTRARGPGLTDVRVLQPGYPPAAAPTFSAPLLSLLSRFEVLRFMDWAATNGNLRGEWAQRANLTNTHTYAGAGVPWEVVFQLCGGLEKDCWINVPINASDDYVTQLATLALAALPASANL
jgi:hypothetical protein